MKWIRTFIVLSAIAVSSLQCAPSVKSSSCWIGAFMSDHPTVKDIDDFKTRFGKKPYVVLVFTAWNNFLDQKIIDDIYNQGSVLMVTWEPWIPSTKVGIDFTALITGKDDAYIKEFASRIKIIEKPVFLRFGHEMNGNWYPWAGQLIGKKNYIAAYRHIKDIFDQMGVKNVQWVFAINWQNIPQENNDWKLYYPGDTYVDYIGIDGYNWGNTQSWSRWMSFKEIFESSLNEIGSIYKKPVIISEFGSASSGGDRSVWIDEALNFISKRKEINGFVLFDVDKEVNWKFIGEIETKRFSQRISDQYFRGINE